MSTLINVSSKDDDTHAQGFADVYMSAFAEAPYFETYEASWVIENVWTPHKQHCIFVTTDDGIVSGLGCAHPIEDTLSPVGEFLLQISKSGQELPFPMSSTLYMSELAVLAQYRKQGLGRELIKARLAWGREAGFTHYCMRTAENGSNSRTLYESLGAKRANFVQSVADENIETQSSHRILLFGSL
jgi:GNAT superfamily N-acetyltransferase